MSRVTWLRLAPGTAKSVDDLPLEVIGKVIAKVTPKKYIERYEASRAPEQRKTVASNEMTLAKSVASKQRVRS